MDRVKSLFSGRNYEAQEDEGNINANSNSGTNNSSSAATPNSADAERGFIAEALDASTLSWSTRIQGFMACFVIGVFIAGQSREHSHYFTQHMTRQLRFLFQCWPLSCSA